MRKNFGAKPWTYPQPVFIIATYGEDGTPDAMNAAWGGISDDTQLSMCISVGHKTTANILSRKAFCSLLFLTPFIMPIGSWAKRWAMPFTTEPA